MSRIKPSTISPSQSGHLFMPSAMLSSLVVELRLRRLAVVCQRTVRADGVGALENPVLPGGQTPVDFRVGRLRPGETQRSFHARERVWRERRAFLDGDANLVVPVEVVRREGYESGLFGLFRVEASRVRERFVCAFGFGEKARL